MGYTLTEPVIALDLLFAFGFWYLVGYNCERFRIFRFEGAIPAAVRAAVRMSFGAAVSVPILFIVWTVTSPQLGYAIFSLASVGLLATSIAKRRVSFDVASNALSQVTIRNSLVFLALPFFLFWLLTRSISYSNWPPAGDIIWVHGPLVALIESLQRIPYSWTPLAAEPIHYPPGFHASVASFNLVWNLLPAQAVFLFGAASIILAVIMLVSIIRVVTSSQILALVGGLCSMYISPAGRLELWLFGYFYNGPYPNLSAILVLLIGVFLLFCQARGTPYLSLQSLLVSETILTACLVILYPPFAIYTVMFAIIPLLRGRAEFSRGLSLRSMRIGISIFLSLVLAIVLLSLGSWNWTSTAAYLLNYGQGYYISVDQLLNGFSGILLIVALAISIARIGLKREENVLHYLYSIVFVLILISTYQPLYRFLSLMLPNRSFVFLYLLSIIVVLHFASSLGNFLSKVDYFPIRTRPTILVTGLVCTILFASIGPSLWFFVSGAADRGYLWFPDSEAFKDDLTAMIWLRENVPANQLILNDLSFSGEYLSSVATLNVSFSPVNINLNNSRAKLFAFWTNPVVTLSLGKLISASGIDVFWSVGPSWGQGDIGTPDLLNAKTAALTAAAFVPEGKNRFWGIAAVLNRSIDLRPYFSLRLNISSSYSLGLSLLIQDHSGNYARYDFVSDNSSLVTIQLDEPSGRQGAVEMSDIVKFAFLTGYVGPFPRPRETLVINGFDVSAPNPNLVTLLRDFDVRYVFVTSEWGMYPGTAVGGNDTYVAKPYTPTEYNRILSRLPYLTPVFISGNSIVYRTKL